MFFHLKTPSPISREEFIDELVHRVFTRRKVLETYASKLFLDCKTVGVVYFMAYGMIIGRFPEALDSEEAFREKADLILTFCHPTEDHPPSNLFDECDFDKTLEKPSDDAGKDALFEWHAKTGKFVFRPFPTSGTCQEWVDLEVKMAKTLALSKELPPFIDYMPNTGEGFGHLTVKMTPMSMYEKACYMLPQLSLVAIVGMVAYVSYHLLS